MDRVIFGRMNREVTHLGLGAWALGSGSYGDVDREEALGIIDTYVTGGGDFIDTATGYRKSQEIIGAYLENHPGLREKLFICSKTGRMGGDEIKEDVESSLKSMKTDYIDLYYLHSPPEDKKERDRVIKVFSSLRDEGIIRGIGASIKGPNVTKETQEMCSDYIKTGEIDALQIIYSIFRQTNSDIFDEASEAGVALVARTALESGMLTGKYKPGHVFPREDHRSRWGRDDLDKILKETALLEKNLEPEFVNLSQKALRFSYEEGGITALIVGATSRGQMEKNWSVTTLTPPRAGWREELKEKYGNSYRLGNLAG